MKKKGDNFSRRLNISRAFGFQGGDEGSSYVQKVAKHFDRSGHHVQTEDHSMIQILQNSL